MQLAQLSQASPVAGQEALIDSIDMDDRLRMLEFAAVIIFLLKFKKSYLPDYTI